MIMVGQQKYLVAALEPNNRIAWFSRANSKQSNCRENKIFTFV